MARAGTPEVTTTLCQAKPQTQLIITGRRKASAGCGALEEGKIFCWLQPNPPRTPSIAPKLHGHPLMNIKSRRDLPEAPSSPNPRGFAHAEAGLHLPCHSPVRIVPAALGFCHFTASGWGHGYC